MKQDDPRRRPKNSLKGRIGEAIVESLLEEAGNKIKRFGQEWGTTSVPDLSLKIFENGEKAPKKVRIKPDFAICNRNGQVEGVEAKFMATDSFLYYLKDNGYFRSLAYHWPGTRVVVVCLADPVLQVAIPPYIKDDNFILVPIWEIQEWGVTRDLYAIYERLIRALPMAELENKKIYTNGGT